MAVTLTKNVSDLSMSSTWRGVHETNDPTSYWYTTPSTDSDSRLFSLSGLPANAILKTAAITGSVSGVYSGIAFLRINGSSFSSGSLDVLAALKAMAGSYGSGFTAAFTFKANGGIGTRSAEPGTPHTGAVALTNLKLTITYEIPTSTCTISTPNAAIEAGETISIIIKPASSTVKHKVKITFGAHTDESGFLGPYSEDTPYKSPTVPLSWLDTIPDRMVGTATLRLTTYTAAGAVSGYIDYSFTIACPASEKPTVTLSDVTNIPASEALAAVGFLQSKSRAEVHIASESIKYGSPIVSRKVMGAGFESSTSALTTGVIAQAGTLTFTVEVTDKRGQKGTDLKSITVKPYTAPYFDTKRVDRCNSSGVVDLMSQYAWVYATFGCATIDGFTNTVACTVKYREKGATPWGAAVAVLNATGVKVGSDDLLATKEYEFLLTITDAVGTAVERMVPMGKAQVIMHFGTGGKSVGIGVIAGADNTLTLQEAWDFIFKGQSLEDRFVKVTGDKDVTMGSDTNTVWRGIQFKRLVSSLLGSLQIGAGVLDGKPVVSLLAYHAGALVGRVDLGEYLKSTVLMEAPRLALTSTTDASGTADNDAPLTVGPRTGAHLAMDGNEVMAKTNGTTAGPLYLNSDGGDVYANLKKVWHQGNLKFVIGSVSMTVVSAGTVVTTDVDYTAMGFTAPPTVIPVVVTTNPTLFDLSTGTPTTTTCPLYLNRSSGTGASTVRWLAIGV